MYGSWQCCDYITHSAIIITADITFDLNDPDTLENIDLISKWGDFGVYTHNGDECPYGKTKDISFQYVTAYRPKTNASYNLTNYSGQINETATISSSNDNTNNYEMYELNVNYFKYYELNVSANSNLDVRLYDEHMQLVEFDDLNESDSNVHFINSLTNGERYYLRVAYDNSSSIGTIYTTMTSRNTAYLSIGENNILINTYNGDNTYYYINHSGVGFYKFTLQATKADGSVLTFPNEAIFIKDHMDEAQIDKYDVMEYSKLAETDYGFNSMYAYLYTGGYFYIHINMQAADYSDLKLIIERAEVDTIDVSGRTDEEFTDMLFSTNESIDYAKGFVIDQIAKFKLNVTTSSTPINNITFILFKKNYNSVTATYYKTDIVADYLPYTPVELILDEVTYYIGYFGNTNGITITCTLERVLELSNITTQVLVLDPDVVNTYGTEVRHNNGEFGETTITEGFTRHIHFTNMAGVPSISRYDYSFYSSNQNYATVSEYGTVFAKAVSSNKTVTITAVYKADPSKIFIIEVTILNDTSGVQRTIETTQTISLSDFENGKYKLVLNETNSPYPWIQYFNWSVYVPCQEVDILVNMDYYGFLTTTGTGSATLTGEYTINPNVTIIIHIRFI